MPTNKERSDRIKMCFNYVIEYGKNADDPTAAVTDILTDLRHFSDANGVHFYKACERSYEFYLKEQKPDPIKVEIEVHGGVAYCYDPPDGVQVEIIDHDNIEAEKEDQE